MYSLLPILHDKTAEILQKFSFFPAALATVVHYDDNKILQKLPIFLKLKIFVKLTPYIRFIDNLCLYKQKLRKHNVMHYTNSFCLVYLNQFFDY